MDSVQALAILSLGAFVTILVTALVYLLTVRPRLLEPVPMEAVGLLDDTLRDELSEQRTVVEQLNTALAHHTRQLEAAAGPAGPGAEAVGSLREMLQAQSETVHSLTGLINAQSTRLSDLGERLSRQEATLNRTAEQVATLGGTMLPDLVAKVEGQDNKIFHLAEKLDTAAPDESLSRLEGQMAQVSTRLGDLASAGPLADLIQQQADRLQRISARLDEWADASTQRDRKLAEHARILAGLDRELAAQAELSQKLDDKVGEHTTMLVTAAKERREQAGLLERIGTQIGDVLALLKQKATQPPRPSQDRLTDIKGVGPIYGGKLYEAGIYTFQQLAAMTPEELDTLIGAPKWRAIDAESWIEQARHLASHREKVEGQS